jgi:hypothetical protein
LDPTAPVSPEIPFTIHKLYVRHCLVDNRIYVFHNGIQIYESSNLHSHFSDFEVDFSFRSYLGATTKDISAKLEVKGVSFSNNFRFEHYLHLSSELFNLNEKIIDELSVQDGDVPLPHSNRISQISVPSFEIKPDWQGKDTVFYKVVFSLARNETETSDLFLDPSEALEGFNSRPNFAQGEKEDEEENDGMHDLVVYRRFSQFLILYDIFVATLSHSSSHLLSSMPPRPSAHYSWASMTSKHFNRDQVEKRRMDLQLFLQRIVQFDKVASHQDLFYFLSLDPVFGRKVDIHPFSSQPPPSLLLPSPPLEEEA